jgi:hypothetical protein
MSLGAERGGAAGRAASGAIAVLDARSDPRVAADFAVSVFSSDFSGPLPARARDLSVGGMCLATRSVVALGSLRSVRLELADGPLVLAAEGRWQRESHSEECVLSGLAFAGPGGVEAEKLWRVVQVATHDLALFLSRSAGLGELGPDHAMGLAQLSRYRLVHARRALYRHDAPLPGDDSIFVVLRGRVELRHRIRATEEIGAPHLGPGALFGGLPCVADVPNLESALAAEDTRLLEVTRPAYAYACLAKPLLAQRLAKVVLRAHVQRACHFLQVAAARTVRPDPKAPPSQLSRPG